MGGTDNISTERCLLSEGKSAKKVDDTTFLIK
jgi:hypothetical protein